MKQDDFATVVDDFGQYPPCTGVERALPGGAGHVAGEAHLCCVGDEVARTQPPVLHQADDVDVKVCIGVGQIVQFLRLGIDGRILTPGPRRRKRIAGRVHQLRFECVLPF